MGFYEVYDAVLAGWPVPAEPIEVGTPFGTTRVNACGPADGKPLVLLHGGGATSTVWPSRYRGRLTTPSRSDRRTASTPGSSISLPDSD